MTFPRLLAAVTRLDKSGALALVDLDDETCEVVAPYRVGGFAADARRFYLGHVDVGLTQTRLEVYDAEGLLWLRRIPHCVDAHSVAFNDNEIAIVSTGTNEVVFVDHHGVETRRWSPDPAAEPDSWHLNTVFCHDGRFFVTCFGSFARFREWAAQRDLRGLLVEVPSGRVVVGGLTMPHDPVRADGGWYVNDSGRKRTIFCPDGGSPETVVELPHFTRGLVVLPDHLLVGLSVPRQDAGGDRRAQIAVVERRSGRLVKKVRIPFLEIGHLMPAPPEALLAALGRDQTTRVFAFAPPPQAFAAADRKGRLRVVSPEGPVSCAERCGVVVELTNTGDRVWSSDGEPPLVVGHEIVDDAGRLLWRGPGRTPLPWALGPGRTITFPVPLDLTTARWSPAAAAVRLTLVLGRDDWWAATPEWSPGTVPVAGACVAGGELLLQNRDLLTRFERSQADLKTLRERYDVVMKKLADEREKTAGLGARSLRVLRWMQRAAVKARGLIGSGPPRRDAA